MARQLWGNDNLSSPDKIKRFNESIRSNGPCEVSSGPGTQHILAGRDVAGITKNRDTGVVGDKPNLLDDLR
jgi:hypothetical protein